MGHATIDAGELGDNVNRYGPTAARPASPRQGKLETTTVDIHAHVAVPEAESFVTPHLNHADITMVKFSNDETRAINSQQVRDRQVAIRDLDDRIKVLDAMGIDMQVVSPPPGQCYYTVAVEAAVEATRMVNDGIAAFVAKRPDRFAGFGSVPMQDGREAARELERCIGELGLKGVEVLTSVNGNEVSAPEFEPFWQAAEEIGACVMLHPNGFTEGRRFMDHYFSNVIGNPLDTAVALHRLIFDGVLERMPNLKILAVHGGGLLPAYSGRIDHAWGARRDARAGLPNPPTHYLRKIYFDSVVFTPHQLEYLVNVYGADKIMMGTDYPFDMGEYDPVGHVLSVESFSEDQVAKVAGRTALNFLGIQA